MRHFTIPYLLFLAACADFDVDPHEGDYQVDVVGIFEPENPDDPLSAWVGTETTFIENRYGVVVCEANADVAGPAIVDDETELTLEILRAEIRELGEACDLVYEVQESVISGARFLYFAGHPGRLGEERGMVKTASDLGGWTVYALGLRLEETLAYHRSWTLSESSDGPDVLTDLDVRPLDEVPSY